MSQVKDVSIVLDTYPQTKAIKEGTLSNPGIHLNFTEYKPIRKAFDDMLNMITQYWFMQKRTQQNTQLQLKR